jgi:hypothetical protein
VQFRFGTTVTAGGSALTVSLQDLGTTFPLQPDETQDQYRAVTIPASNTWYTSGLVTNDGTDTGSKRTVSFGDGLAVVVEFDGAGRLGSDSAIISALGQISNTHSSELMLKTGGTWAPITAAPAVILEFSDGTFGTLAGGIPCSAFNSHSYKQDTGTADEYALEFQVPWPCKVDGAWGVMNTVSASGDLDVVLYDGTTAMTNGTITFPGEHGISNNVRSFLVEFPAEITLQANYTYRLGFKPTQTAQAITVQSVDVSNANHWTCWPGGTACNYTTRLDAGSWASPTTTRRLLAGIRISALDDGASAGGIQTHPGMAGGMRG